MPGTSVAPHATARQRPTNAEIMRRASFGTAVGLLIQYALGMAVNLYVTVPARDHGGGAAAAIGRAVSNGPG